MEQKPFALWELEGTRRVVTIAFMAGLTFLILAYFPYFDSFYNGHPKVKDFAEGLVVLSGVGMAFFELRHSHEANEHRAELNRLNGETLQLQTRIHVLQEEIERKLTKVRFTCESEMATMESSCGPRISQTSTCGLIKSA